MKVCTKCGIEKPLDEFGKHKNCKHGRAAQCKDCTSKYQAKYYQNNKDYLINYAAKYYQENKSFAADYHLKHRDRINKQAKERAKSFVLYKSKYLTIQSLKLYEETKESKDGYLECKCAYCGEWFTPTYGSIKSRVDSINSTNRGECRLYCSDECKQACPTYNQVKWPKGHKKATSNPYYTTYELSVWSKEVLTRANYKCQLCDSDAVHAHHIQSKKLQPALALDPDNGIAVCERCHYDKLHKGSNSTGALANMVCNTNSPSDEVRGSYNDKLNI